jgi:NADH dehydrogenase/NADH:ubiquinone oxidoreductase subunit G
MPASWNEALDIVLNKLSSSKAEEIGAIAGTLADLESMYLLKISNE